MLLRELYSGCYEVYTLVFDVHVRRLNHKEAKQLTDVQKKAALTINTVPKVWKADEWDEYFEKPRLGCCDKVEKQKTFVGEA